jgi:hypothetical protein
MGKTPPRLVARSRLNRDWRFAALFLASGDLADEGENV